MNSRRQNAFCAASAAGAAVNICDRTVRFVELWVVFRNAWYEMNSRRKLLMLLVLLAATVFFSITPYIVEIEQFDLWRYASF